MRRVALGCYKFLMKEENMPKTKTKVAANAQPFKVGQAYFIRTVTYHLVGKLTAIQAGFLVLTDASWIADSGRFMSAIKDGSLSEVEPVGDAIVNIAAITDAFPWAHTLPKEQK